MYYNGLGGTKKLVSTMEFESWISNFKSYSFESVTNVNNDFEELVYIKYKKKITLLLS